MAVVGVSVVITPVGDKVWLINEGDRVLLSALGVLVAGPLVGESVGVSYSIFGDVVGLKVSSAGPMGVGDPVRFRAVGEEVIRTVGDLEIEIVGMFVGCPVGPGVMHPGWITFFRAPNTFGLGMEVMILSCEGIGGQISTEVI